MTTPAGPVWPQGKRPYVNCHRSSDYDPQQPPPAPGTIVETASGTTVLYVGAEWNHTQAETDALAERLRGANKIEIVGDVWKAGRPCKHALNLAWTTANRAAREAAKPPRPEPAPKTTTAQCGQPTRYGTPCQRSAGWATDTIGTGPCADHGGSTERLDREHDQLVEQTRVITKLVVRARNAGPDAQEHLTAVLDLQSAVLQAWTRARKPRRRAAPAVDPLPSSPTGTLPPTAVEEGGN